MLARIATRSHLQKLRAELGKDEVDVKSNRLTAALSEKLEHALEQLRNHTVRKYRFVKKHAAGVRTMLLGELAIASQAHQAYYAFQAYHPTRFGSSYVM